MSQYLLKQANSPTNSWVMSGIFRESLNTFSNRQIVQQQTFEIIMYIQLIAYHF